MQLDCLASKPPVPTAVCLARSASPHPITVVCLAGSNSGPYACTLVTKPSPQFLHVAFQNSLLKPSSLCCFILLSQGQQLTTLPVTHPNRFATMQPNVRHDMGKASSQYLFQERNKAVEGPQQAWQTWRWQALPFPLLLRGKPQITSLKLAIKVYYLIW